MENNATPSLLKSTATYGSILGVIMVIYSVFFYIFDIMPVGIIKPILFGLISIAIYIVGMVIFAKKVRNTYYPNNFPFGKAFITCLLIAAFAILISSIYSYIQSALIDPEYYNRYMEAQKEYMTNFLSNRGVPEDQIQATIDKMDEGTKGYNALTATIKSFFIFVAISAIISLIIAAVIKKNVKIFDQN